MCCLLCYTTFVMEVPVYLLWDKRGQVFIKRFKSLTQCHTGGINQHGKKENQLVGVESIRLEMMSDISQITALHSRASRNRDTQSRLSSCCILLPAPSALHYRCVCLHCCWAVQGRSSPPPPPPQAARLGVQKPECICRVPCPHVVTQHDSLQRAGSGQQLPGAK